MHVKKGNLDVWTRLSKDRLAHLESERPSDVVPVLNTSQEAERIIRGLILPAFEAVHEFSNTSQSLSILIYPLTLSSSLHLLAIETHLCMESSVHLVLSKIPCANSTSPSQNVWREVERMAPNHHFFYAGTYLPDETGVEMKMYEMLLDNNLA